MGMSASGHSIAFVRSQNGLAASSAGIPAIGWLRYEAAPDCGARRQ